jgi:hypothetical protein
LSPTAYSTTTKIYNNEAIVAFLSSKIANAAHDADVVDEVKSPTTLSCRSLDDRYLPAFKRLQFRECGTTDDAGWAEVKLAVLTRATKACLPLISKGKTAVV